MQMNVMEKQFTMNREASRKQIPANWIAVLTVLLLLAVLAVPAGATLLKGLRIRQYACTCHPVFRQASPKVETRARVMVSIASRRAGSSLPLRSLRFLLLVHGFGIEQEETEITEK